MVRKTPTRYLRGDGWTIAEERFHPERQRVSESIFSLSNEFMGVRGYFEEGYSGDHLQGSYFGGLYETKEVGHPQVFKGFVTNEHYIINAVDWLFTRIRIDDEPLDLAKVNFSEFSRRTDMKRGVGMRSFVWETKSGKKLRCSFERFLSMVDPNLGCQRIVFKPLNFSGTITIRSALNFGTVQEIDSGWNMTVLEGAVKTQSSENNKWTMYDKQLKNGLYTIQAQTKSTDFSCVSSFRLNASQDIDPQPYEEDYLIGCEFELYAQQGQECWFDKIVVNFWERPWEMSPQQVWERGMEMAIQRSGISYDDALTQHREYWSRKWENWDILIEGEDDLQQGVRFDLFQFHMAYHAGDERLAIPSKGLTAEVYSGWVFWVVESYCQHVMVFSDPEASRKLLRFRYLGLKSAIERATQLDCEGAKYPFCTIDGPESCATWQHADMEIHVGEAIFLAIERYMKHVKDNEFLYSEGMEMLLQMCRYYASRGDWSPQGGFGFYGVMGPDEYKTLVNHNYYINYMAKKCFEYTLSWIDTMRESAADALAKVEQKIGASDEEYAQWRQMADKMILLQDPDSGVCEQNEGFFNLPTVDVRAIGEDQIPLYNNWAYERILRSRMVKQADVLLLPVWYAHEWSHDAKKANYDYYEPITIHESSFSPSIHQILAAELGYKKDADEFFRLMARLDLDDYNKNTAQGLHMTPKSGTWMCMVYGYGGMRTDTEPITFAPSIPEAWQRYRFRITCRGSLLQVTVTQSEAEFVVIRGDEIPVKIYEKEYTLGSQAISVALQR